MEKAALLITAHVRMCDSELFQLWDCGTVQVANAVAPLVSRLGAAAMQLRRAEEGASLLRVPFTSLFEYLVVRYEGYGNPLKRQRRSNGVNYIHSM